MLLKMDLDMEIKVKKIKELSICPLSFVEQYSDNGQSIASQIDIIFQNSLKVC